MPSGHARLGLVVAGSLALGACDQPNDWPLPTRQPSSTSAVAAEAIPAAQPGCPDPVVGLWVARRFDGVKWNEHRLRLDRQGGQLTCAQESRSWYGDATSVAPPPCPRGGVSYHLVYLSCAPVEQAATLDVRSVTILSESHTCADEFPGYNLDHFTGELHDNTWTSSNNDGGDDLDKPYTFRRLSCAP
ncbi:MAG: hypothetical protein IPL61_35755 [Myxococcales bacterium]|nr:hypothetical protein [Myxococcales bacterium]